MLKKIVNVYYLNCGAGFGDFLRGSLFLIDICIERGLDFDMDISHHPMSNFLNYDYNINRKNIDLSKIITVITSDSSITNNQRFITISKINSCTEENLYLFCNNFCPDLKLNIMKAIDIIISKIEPKQFILDLLDNKLNTYQLKRKQYDVIHIRTGDYNMNIKLREDNYNSHNHSMSIKHLNDIIHYIHTHTDQSNQIILIGDNHQFKKIISSYFNYIKIFDSNITHLGESLNPTNDAIMDTLIDFNLMRFSNRIISFSLYAHGSGFAKYSSFIYDVPFEQIILN